MDLKVIPNIKHLESDNFFLIAGPCAIEGEEMALKIAENCLKICDKLKVPYIFKGSYKKANRSRICLLYTSPSPRDAESSRMPSSA